MLGQSEVRSTVLEPTFSDLASIRHALESTSASPCTRRLFAADCIERIRVVLDDYLPGRFEFAAAIESARLFAVDEFGLSQIRRSRDSLGELLSSVSRTFRSCDPSTVDQAAFVALQAIHTLTSDRCDAPVIAVALSVTCHELLGVEFDFAWAGARLLAYLEGEIAVPAPGERPKPWLAPDWGARTEETDRFLLIAMRGGLGSLDQRRPDGFDPDCPDCSRFTVYNRAHPSHRGSPRCRVKRSIASGGTTPHCTCEACF